MEWPQNHKRNGGGAVTDASRAAGITEQRRYSTREQVPAETMHQALGLILKTLRFPVPAEWPHSNVDF